MDEDPDPHDLDAPFGTEDWPPWLRAGDDASSDLAATAPPIPVETPGEGPEPVATPVEPPALVETPALVEVSAEDPEPGTVAEPAPWAARAVMVGWGLFAVAVIVLLGSLVEGIAAPARQGSLFARLGAAYVGQAGTSDGLAVLAAAGLACWARADRLLNACLVAAVALCVITPLAMSGDVANLHHTHQAVSGLVRWQLVTFFGVTFVPAGLAGLVAWWGRADGLGSPRH